MSDQNYTTAFLVDQTPEETFAAINNVRDWWSGEIEGDTDRLGGEFTYQSGDLHRSTQKITEWIPGEKIVWHVLDSQINFVQDKTEWTGTDIVFEMTKQDDQTELRFTHIGLAPVLACYGDCSDAWGFYINDSLRRLITTGIGQSDQPA
ncbi:MAG: SRPBCC domain-containing protein [Anaerolineae bacterium]|nr:SRPBCC domain-containing protein [Anaerolineae bacterium]